MKSTLFVIMFLFSSWAFADQAVVLLGADFQWGADFNSRFGAEICSVTANNCRALSADDQAIPLDQIQKVIKSHPNLIEDGLFRLRWGFFEETVCCGIEPKPLLLVEVKLVASQVNSGLIRTVYFPDQTSIDSLDCIRPNPVRKANGLGLLYVGSQTFAVEQIIFPNGVVGRPTGNFGISCQK